MSHAGRLEAGLAAIWLEIRRPTPRDGDASESVQKTGVAWNLAQPRPLQHGWMMSMALVSPANTHRRQYGRDVKAGVMGPTAVCLSRQRASLIGWGDVFARTQAVAPSMTARLMLSNVAASGCASYTDTSSYVATIVAREDARVEAVVLLASPGTGAEVEGGFDSQSTARAVDANRKNTTAPARSRPLRVTWRRWRKDMSSLPPLFLPVAQSPCSRCGLAPPASSPN